MNKLSNLFVISTDNSHQIVQKPPKQTSPHLIATIHKKNTKIIKLIQITTKL